MTTYSKRQRERSLNMGPLKNGREKFATSHESARLRLKFDTQVHYGSAKVAEVWCFMALATKASSYGYYRYYHIILRHYDTEVQSLPCP